MIAWYEIEGAAGDVECVECEPYREAFDPTNGAHIRAAAVAAAQEWLDSSCEDASTVTVILYADEPNAFDDEDVEPVATVDVDVVPRGYDLIPNWPDHTDGGKP